ncbi:MAG: energy-coupling factor ABC transporter ATP-binding protein [Thaumarchaeota archaeon]|nr:energy-coupling factor ABC transporter ATP-binding protein [Nitrososphaerota archaeon]
MQALKVEDYTFSYLDTKNPALIDVNLEIAKGEIVVLAGPSGCGKSTLLKSIVGLIPHMYSGSWSGKVIVDGAEVSKTKISELAKKVGFVFQNPENQIFMFSVERDIAFGLENLALPKDEMRQRVDEALSLLNLKNLADRAPHELSDGQKQRTALAGVLAMKPSILILDEPTSLLDPHTAHEVIGTVQKLNKNLGITVIIVEHRLDLVSIIASRLVIMDNGRIVANDAPKKVYNNSEALKAVGMPIMASLHKELGGIGEPPLSVDEFVSVLKIRND